MHYSNYLLLVLTEHFFFFFKLSLAAVFFKNHPGCLNAPLEQSPGDAFPFA